MSKSLWSEREEGMLRFMYISGTSFDDIGKALSARTPNAIRLKASRLGLKRPSDSSSILESPNVLRFSDGNGNSGYFFRCSGCGSWIHVQIEEDEEVRTVECLECKTVCRYVA
jgi:hypothetical protein